MMQKSGYLNPCSTSKKRRPHKQMLINKALGTQQQAPVTLPKMFWLTSRSGCQKHVRKKKQGEKQNLDNTQHKRQFKCTLMPVGARVPAASFVSACVCAALTSDTSSWGNPSRLPGQPAPYFLMHEKPPEWSGSNNCSALFDY